MRLGDKTYCSDCRPGGPGRPADVSSCRECQVFVVHSALSRGVEPAFSKHRLCAVCEKNPVRTPPNGARSVGCGGCGKEIPIRDLRVGIALPLLERGYCPACRGSVERPSGGAPGVEAPPPPAPAPADRDPGLACDRCGRGIPVAEIRSGSAVAKGGTLACGRCAGRDARDAQKRRDDRKFAASLVFVLGVFPLAAAALAIVGYRAWTGGGRGPESAAPAATAPPSPATSPGPSAGTGPAAPVPAAAPSPELAEFRALLAELVRAVRRNDVADAKPPAEAPAAPPPVRRVGEDDLPKPPPDPRPAPGPGSEVAGRIGAEAAAAQERRLADPDAGVRLDAILELAALPGREAGPALLKALADPDPFLRNVAAKALGKVESAEAVRPLFNALADRDAAVRRSAAVSLGRILKTEKFYLLEDLTPDRLRMLRRAIEELERRG
ncbi:MAG: HEAT repeat domain-containing protein [Planctomycetales bacterium]|nr:HEAT repeat domain-containing protein [Planctomycetales bacterium]